MSKQELYGRTLTGELIGPYDTHDELDRELADANREACLDFGDSCSGLVEYRMPLSGTGRAFPRCDAHWERRLDEQDKINAKYGGVCAPADFDPAYAGERWEEDY